MAMIRLTQGRLEEFGEELVKVLGLRPPTPELIDSIGMDLAEKYPEDFHWFTYSTEAQITRIQNWILDFTNPAPSEGIVRPYMYDR